MLQIRSLVVGECWTKSKSEAGTFPCASSEVLSNNGLRVEEPAADADRENIDCGFGGSPDCHTTSIVEELTRSSRLFELLLLVK